jgi:perosamine synthetase
VPLCEPAIGGREWEYVKSCLDTGWVSSVGAYVDRFEAAVAAAVGARHAVATVNGTSALHVALRVAGVEAGDEVLVSSLTFIAPANAISYLGAHPIFVDAEPGYWQMDPALVTRFLAESCGPGPRGLVNRATGRRIGAIMPVHILGHPVDLDPILAAAREHGIPVIEDATESLGATYRGTPVGHLGDIACFSFNGNKLITTGGGGMLVTDRLDWARRARHLTTQAKADPVEYLHTEVGYNYRLTNVLAAIGLAQMERLDVCLAAKRAIAEGYAAALGSLPGVTLMPEAAWARSAFWMYTVLLGPGAALGSRELLSRLAMRGIQTRPLWQPMHRSAAHAGAAALGGAVAERLNREALSLPCSVGLQPEAQRYVIDQILELAARPASRAQAAPA